LALAIVGGLREAEAACINVTAGLPVNVSQPTSGQTVVCDTNPPNPTSTVISAAAGSTNVTVTVLPGATLNTGARAIGVVDNSTVLNQGAISTRLNNAFGITTTGDGSTLTNQGAITTTGPGSFGLDARGSNSTLINSGTIDVSGLNAAGIRSNETTGSTLIINSGTITTASGPGILGANANITLQDSGNITAGNGVAIQLGGGNNVVSITGGQINGNIALGAGNDMVTLFTGSTVTGSIDGGGGTNAFVLDGTGTGLFAGSISNFQTLTKQNTGVWELSGANTYTGTTIVNAGALIVSGSIASSSLTVVNSGAALIGSGTVGSTMINAGGFLVPGPVGTPGTMTVAGNLALQSGAFYIVQLNPTTAATANVSGTASLAGTVGAIFAPGSYLTRSYTILTAAGGRTGTFDALATRGLPANFEPSLSYTGNTAVLNLSAHLVPEGPLIPLLPLVPAVPGLPFPPDQPSASSPPLPTFTVNQLNVGRAIDSFFNNGGVLPPTFVPLFGLTGGNLTNALDQLSGEASTEEQKVAFQLTDQFLNLMLDPFVDGRNGVGGADHPPLGFAPERETVPSDVALAYASVLKAAPKAAPLYQPQWTSWAGAYGGVNHTAGNPVVIGSHDLSARTVGVAGGFDYRLTPDTVVGFALAGGGTGWSLTQGLGDGRSDAFQAGLYGATRWGPAYLAAAFAFTNHWMSTDRTASVDHLTANFDAQSYGGRVEGGYRFATPNAGITPYAAIEPQSFHTPAYAETDAIPNGFALAFPSRDATDTRSELGSRFDRVLVLYPDAVLTLRARLAWAHDWISNPTLVPLFQALPGASFIVNGALPAHNSALASTGVEFRFANGVTLLAKFDGDFAPGSSTYGGIGAVRYTW
jgi:autotransporter-associated beta strand protein